MNVVLNGFFIERNNLNVFRPRFSDQKMYFVLERFLPIVNEGLSLAILNEKSSLTYNFQICTCILTYILFSNMYIVHIYQMQKICTYIHQMQKICTYTRCRKYVHTYTICRKYVIYQMQKICTYTRCRKYVHILDVENMSIDKIKIICTYIHQMQKMCTYT